jgi:hypothetical protein
LDRFNWRDHEDYINSFPNFKLNLLDERCGDFTVHFAALFSKNPDATPIVFLHGWPGKNLSSRLSSKSDPVSLVMLTLLLVSRKFPGVSAYAVTFAETVLTG